MIRFTLQRLFVFVLRVALALFVVGAVVEVSRFIFGKGTEPIWKASLGDPVPSEIAPWVTSWEELVPRRVVNSSGGLLIALLGTFAFGYCWGILSARLRVFRLRSILGLVFQFLASVPGFWFVVLVALYSYVNWQRPGFANDVIVETGPDLLRWWNALIVAIPSMVAAAAWQFRAVNEAVENEISRPFVSGLFMAGFRDDEVFYRQVLKQARLPLASILDRSIPLLLGTMVFAEAAFRFEGMGSLLIESLHQGSSLGLIIASAWMILVSSLLMMIREFCERLSRPRH